MNISHFKNSTDYISSVKPLIWSLEANLKCVPVAIPTESNRSQNTQHWHALRILDSNATNMLHLNIQHQPFLKRLKFMWLRFPPTT